MGTGLWVGRSYTHTHAQKVAGPLWQMVKLTFQQFLSFMSGLSRTFTLGSGEKREEVLFFIWGR